MNRLSEDLYVGDIEAAGTHVLYANHGITAVVQLTYQPPEEGYPEEIKHFHHAMMDGPRNDEQTMLAAIETTRDLLANSERVLVHCSAGESRSVAVATGAAALCDGVTFSDALKSVADIQSPRVHQAVRENAQEAVQILERD